MDNVGIPQFNIKPLHQTKTVSANELQVKVERQTQRKTLKALQNDLHNCAEDLDEGLVPSTNFHWGMLFFSCSLFCFSFFRFIHITIT